MKTRIIQDQPEDARHTPPPKARPTRVRNVAARMGHWSATRRKTAIWGWLVFVVIAVMLGKSIGTDTIHGADRFSGEAGRAERTLEDAGLRPNTEHVFFQSKSLTVRDPQYRAAITDATVRLRHTDHVVNVV